MQEDSARYVESVVRVRYADTDQMGIAHHANYIVWFEIGRTDLCRSVGMTYRDIEAQGYLLVVSDVSCHYRMAFRYDDEVVIHTRVGEMGSRAIEFRYELRSRRGGVGATGMSRHLWVDRKSMKPVRAPNAIVKLFEQFDRQ